MSRLIRIAQLSSYLRLVTVDPRNARVLRDLTPTARIDWATHSRESLNKKQRTRHFAKPLPNGTAIFTLAETRNACIFRFQVHAPLSDSISTRWRLLPYIHRSERFCESVCQCEFFFLKRRTELFIALRCKLQLAITYSVRSFTQSLLFIAYA